MRKENLSRKEFLALLGLGLAGCAANDTLGNILRTPLPPTEFKPTTTKTGTTEVKPTATATQPKPTSTSLPTETATPEADVIDDLIKEAYDSGQETITIFDPNGIEVVVDVVPPEVLDVGKWDWQYRGFTREDEGNLQVWRTLKGRDNMELSQWMDVVSSLDVDGYGRLTIEFDRQKMATRSGGDPERVLNEIFLEEPELWKKALNIYWGDKVDSRKVAEPSDYGIISDALTSRNVVPYEIFDIERIVRNGGASFILVPSHDESFNVAETWKGEPTVAFKNTAQAGRPVVILYFAYWVFDGIDLRSGNIGLIGLNDLGYFIGEQRGSTGVVDMVREDRNPWRVGPSNKARHIDEKVLKEIGGWDVGYWSPLVGPVISTP